MKIFLLDNSQATRTIAPIFCSTLKKSAMNMKFVTKEFDKDSKYCFQGIDVRDFSATYWLGNMHANQIGDFTASDFAAKFNREFENAFQDKTRVEHIYLVGYGSQVVQETACHS